MSIKKSFAIWLVSSIAIAVVLAGVQIYQGTASTNAIFGVVVAGEYWWFDWYTVGMAVFLGGYVMVHFRVHGKI